ncbi:MAG: hypothetical protein ACYDEA_05510 [Candidatus Dormibacteria bacterium]
MAEPIGRRWLGLLVTLGLGLAGAGLAAAPVDAAPLWWTPAPSLGRPISQIASDTGAWTLAISRGVAGWLDPTSGSFSPVEGGAGAAFVATHGADGLVLCGSGRLVETTDGGPTRSLQILPGRPSGLGIGPGRRPMVVAATSAGLFWGYLGSPLSHRAATFRAAAPGALAAPVRSGQPFVVVTANGVLLLLPDGRVRISVGAPRLGSHPRVVELSDGVLLAGDRTGLIWGLYRSGWQPVFQLLPYGGLGGVPALTAMIADGPTAAYLATAGFGTLLTPDGGYTWYRAAPPVADVAALATLGPVFSAKPSGLVVAATPAGLFLHRLQALPAPPAYSGAGLEQQILGTIGVTVAATALAILLMWWPKRRRRGRLSV